MMDRCVAMLLTVAAILPAVGCRDRVVAKVLDAYDMRGKTSFSADTKQRVCLKQDSKLQQGEPLSAHYLKISFRNTQDPSSDDSQANTETPPGTEFLRRYVVTYVSEENGPALSSQAVAGFTHILPPSKEVIIDNVILADFATKEQFETNRDRREGARRYTAQYDFEGDDRLSVSLDVSFLLGDFDECDVLGSGWYEGDGLPGT